MYWQVSGVTRLRSRQCTGHDPCCYCGFPIKHDTLIMGPEESHQWKRWRTARVRPAALMGMRVEAAGHEGVCPLTWICCWRIFILCCCCRSCCCCLAIYTQKEGKCVRINKNKHCYIHIFYLNNDSQKKTFNLDFLLLFSSIFFHKSHVLVVLLKP